MYIKLFEEFSKNDPIPEVYGDNVAFFLIGPPGSGKSTFRKSFLSTKKDIKVFSSDQISKLYTKDIQTRYEKVGEMIKRKIKAFIPTKQSFIYDTSGNWPMHLTDLVNRCHSNNYKVVFIHLSTSMEQALDQNKERQRNVDEEYIRFSYENIDKSIDYYKKNLKLDAFYVVTNMNHEYKFFKYDLFGKLLKRTGGVYQ